VIVKVNISGDYDEEDMAIQVANKSLCK